MRWSGIGIGLVLVVTWVVAYVVMKVTSAAIHLLILGAVVMLALNVVGRLRGGSSAPPD
ncbi:MAG: hypothetical protein ABW352_04630 [Polyangiales bacterium]